MSALQVAIDRLWAALGDRDGLMPSLPDDAVMARARGGEAKAAMPRLMELLVADEVLAYCIIWKMKLGVIFSLTVLIPDLS